MAVTYNKLWKILVRTHIGDVDRVDARAHRRVGGQQQAPVPLAPQGTVLGARVRALGEDGVLQGPRRKGVRVGVEGLPAVEVVGVDGGPRAGFVIDPDVHQPAVGGGQDVVAPGGGQVELDPFAGVEVDDVVEGENDVPRPAALGREIGRASCRERV